MAHLRKHPGTGKWQVRYVDPAMRERSKTFSRKADAEHHLHSVEADKLRGEWIDPDRAGTRFGDWAQRWLATRSHLKPQTLAGYESLLRNHVQPVFGRMRMDHIDSMTIETWVADLAATGLSASRVRQAHQVLSAALEAAVRSRHLPSNPARGVKLPRLPQREMRFLAPAQVDDLAEAIPEPYETLVYLLAYGGLRWGEATALRRGRVDVLRSRIEVRESLAEVSGQVIFGTTKNHKNRTVTVPAFLRDMLNDHLQREVTADLDALVFTTAGRYYSPNSPNVGAGAVLRNTHFARRVWRPAVAAAGLPDGLRIHDLRHTCAAIMIASGAHPEAIKRQLGHSSITVTMDQYGHLFPSEADELAQRLDTVFRESQTDYRRTKTDSSRIHQLSMAR